MGHEHSVQDPKIGVVEKKERIEVIPTDDAMMLEVGLYISSMCVCR